MEVGNVIREFNRRGEVIFEGLILRINENKNTIYLKVSTPLNKDAVFILENDGSVDFSLSYMKKCLERDDHVLLK